VCIAFKESNQQQHSLPQLFLSLYTSISMYLALLFLFSTDIVFFFFFFLKLVETRRSIVHETARLLIKTVSWSYSVSSVIDFHSFLIPTPLNLFVFEIWKRFSTFVLGGLLAADWFIASPNKNRNRLRNYLRSTWLQQ
jgi:hypothetical protein